MSNTTELVRRVRDSFRRSWNLHRLVHDGSSISERIGYSIKAASTGNFAEEETRWFETIELLRTEMNKSTKPLRRTDYGAGNPNVSRTPDEMRAGVEVADTVGNFCQLASKPAPWCRLLFKLVQSVDPSSCIEMGTALGISAAYQAAALRINGGGVLVTLEGATSLADIAVNNIRRLGLDNVQVIVGRFEETLPRTLKVRQPIDYIFIDGHHDEQATLSYFELMLPFLADTALLVFDDIAWSKGMRNAWNTVTLDKRVRIAVDLGPVGLCVIEKRSAKRAYFEIPLTTLVRE